MTASIDPSAGPTERTTARQYGPWSIVRREVLSHRTCWRTRQPITTPWIAQFAVHPVSREAIVAGDLPGGEPDGLVAMLDALNERLVEPDGDRLNVGLMDSTYDRGWPQGNCAHTAREFEEYVPPQRRGRWDVGVGLTPGHQTSGLGAWATFVLSPRLAAFLDAFYGTQAPDRLFTPDEKLAKQQADDRAAAAAAQAAREAQALDELAVVLFGKATDATRERARGVGPSIEKYVAAVAARVG